MLIYLNWGCLFIGAKYAGFTVFRMLCNATEDADLLVVRLLIKKNWGCWFFGSEDAGVTGIEDAGVAGIEDAGFMVFWMQDNGNEDADLLELRMLI